MEAFYSPRIRTLRYRELLLVLVLVAVSAWAFSRPGLMVQFSNPTLLVTVTPGKTLDDTIFDVRYQGPEKYQPEKDLLSLRLEDAPTEIVGFEKVEQLAANHWRVRGQDMLSGEKTYFEPRKRATPRVGRTSHWTALMVAGDPEASRHSRGANVIQIQSDQFELRLRNPNS